MTDIVDAPQQKRIAGLTTLIRPTGASMAEETATEGYRRFGLALAMGDILVVVAALAIGHVVRFGLTNPALAEQTRIPISYLPLSLCLGAAWLVLLAVYRAYEPAILGVGVEEYLRCYRATFALFGGLAIVSYLFKIDVSRGYFLAILPLGLVLILTWRRMARKVLVRQRQAGHMVHRTLVLGGAAGAAEQIANELGRHPELGISVVAVCVQHYSGPDAPVAAPPGSVCRTVDDVREVMRQSGADTLLITTGAGLTPDMIRQFSWSLDPETEHLLIAPALVDVAGPRTQLRPVDGMALIQVDIPRFSGTKYVFKRTLDILTSLVLIILLVPIWILVPFLIWREDRGPVLFRQGRVGMMGKEFTMFKFRSMRPDAEELLAGLKAQQSDRGAGNEVLFKMRNDPRITRIGRVLRRYSVDELPQLFNVLRGSMSLVGPRPPLQCEVDQYAASVRRKFLVRPGITGLWQVNGRSNLTWKESVRLDLYYVENWSLIGDLRILFRTVKVVLGRDGAY